MNSTVRLSAACCVLLFLLANPALAQNDDSAGKADITGLSLEQLLDTKVYSASKFLQKTSEAPASVTIITADDIRIYGYRTLADILKSVRGLYVDYDRNYQYLGVRGFERPGDYDSRILLLVDGYRLNDPVYGQASIGTEFPVDVALIDRVEVVRGAGSSIYGSNAFFAVINVITRRGQDMHGLEAAGGLASFGTDSERLSDGGKLENGLEWLVSGTRYNSKGQDLFYPEFDTPANNNGVAEGRDGDRAGKFLVKLAKDDFTLQAGYSRRVKQIPTASFGTEFNSHQEQTTDETTFLDLGYYGYAGPVWELTPHLFYGHYSYAGIYPYAGPGSTTVINRDTSVGEWWGSEIRAVGRFDRHKLVVGAEYQHNLKQDQTNFDESPHTLYLDDHRHSDRVGAYVQDEFSFTHELLLNAGLRYDHYSDAGGSTNPRIALIWSPSNKNTLKLIYGTSFRTPNAYELHYAATDSKANPELQPEKITTYEFILDHYFQPDLRVTLDAYHNELRDLITQVIDPADGLEVFRNTGRVKANGVELEAERAWNSGTRLLGSYAWQTARDETSHMDLTNSPRHLAKLHLAVPIFANALMTGTELQYIGRRTTLSGGSTAGALVVNLTLSSARLVEGLELSLSAYNLLDKKYADPARPEHVQDKIQQDGRNFRFTIAHSFGGGQP